MMKKKFIPLFILLFYMLNINSQEFTHPGLLHSESSLKESGNLSEMRSNRLTVHLTSCEECLREKLIIA